MVPGVGGVGCGWLSGGQGADFDQVVGQDAVSAPGGDAVESVNVAACPAESVLDAADASFAAGAPLDQSPQGACVFLSLAGGGWFAIAWYRDGCHPKVVQGLVDVGFDVAAVGGGGARR